MYFESPAIPAGSRSRGPACPCDLVGDDCESLRRRFLPILVAFLVSQLKNCLLTDYGSRSCGVLLILSVVSLILSQVEIASAGVTLRAEARIAEAVSFARDR